MHGTHELLPDLPGGPLNLAIGAQWFKEEHDETPPPLIESGVQAGDSIYVIGTEYDRAAFVELDGNPVKSLNINIQGRYDNYQDLRLGLHAEDRIQVHPVELDRAARHLGQGLPRTLGGGGHILRRGVRCGHLQRSGPVSESHRLPIRLRSGQLPEPV